MIRPIMKDPLFLSRKSTPATTADIPAAMDLLQTLSAHEEECVGMAANMIGVLKRIIVFFDENDDTNKIMFNPEIISKSGEYEAVEGCLSLPGQRSTKRYKKIVVKYQDFEFKWHKATYTEFTAQIIQHELDMCDGILI